jgi:hypothetical protein
VISFDHLSFTGEVVYCGTRGRQYLICITVSPRGGPAASGTTHLPARVMRDSGMYTLPGTVMDISKSGLGFEAVRRAGIRDRSER